MIDRERESQSRERVIDRERERESQSRESDR